MQSHDDQGHRCIDEGNLAYHRAVAAYLRVHPDVIHRALANIDRWERRRGPYPYYDVWRRLLSERSAEEIVTAITADDEHGRALRQSTPFVGILPERDRLRLLRTQRRNG